MRKLMRYSNSAAMAALQNSLMTFKYLCILHPKLWTFGITLLGFFLGKSLPPEQVDKYLLPIIGLIIVVSLVPSIIHLIQENRTNRG